MAKREFTEEELKLAMKQALKEGDENKARTIAYRITQMQTQPQQSGTTFSDAERARRDVEGSLASPVRVKNQPTSEGGITSVGTAKDVAKGAGRTATALLGLPGEVVNLLGVDQNGMLMPIPGISQMQGAVEKVAGEGALEGGEDTLAGRSGEFIGGGLLGGTGNIIKGAAQAGARGAARQVGRNVLASEAALVGSEVGGEFASQLGIPRGIGQLSCQCSLEYQEALAT